MTYHKKISSCAYLFLLIILMAACNKVDITFGETASSTDPNITYFDNYATTIATYKVDSFLTSNHQIFSVGYNYDSVFGIVKAASYAQLNLPANPFLNITQTVYYDSLELILNPNGNFYGDSTKPMKLSVYRLTQNIKDDVNGDNYYNTSSFNYDANNPIGTKTFSLDGKSGTPIHMRLSDALGQEILNKFVANDNDISGGPDYFINYFRGLYIASDNIITKSLAYFNTGTDTALVKLSYHLNGLSPQEQTLNFSYFKPKQFNNINFSKTNTSLLPLVSGTTQLLPSSTTSNKSFLNSNLGAYIKISFPTLLNLKELHPYVKVVKALLLVRPDVKSFINSYQLPPTLNLYTTDQYNALGSGIFYNGTTTPTLQTGNLVVDNLYGENTFYTFDVTNFINSKIDAGQFSTSSLFLYPTVSSFDAGLQRLIINDQTFAKGIQLKLYVLGL